MEKKRLFGLGFLLVIFLSLNLVSGSISDLIDQGLENEVNESSLSINQSQDKGLGVEKENVSEKGFIPRTHKSEVMEGNQTEEEENRERVEIGGEKKEDIDKERVYKEAQKITRTENRKGFLERVVIGFKELFGIRRVQKSPEFTGNLSIDLPEYPSPPSQNIEKPWHMRIWRFITGRAIVDVPNWAYKGADGKRFSWEASFTEKAYNKQHFDLFLESNIGVENAVNGIVYNKGYYLDEKKREWKNFSFEGIRIGSTDWLRKEGQASITLEDYTDNDYAIFLAYQCLKIEDNWNCNENKWILFVVETGETYYHGDPSETPPMEYKESKDLNVSDIPSILKQLNISAMNFRPAIHDGLLVPQKTDLSVREGQVGELEFYIKNLGNENLTNLTLELDIGEQDLAEVVGADLPKTIGVNETIKGEIDILFKEQGNWKFPLWLEAKQEEVDTSDNAIYFSVEVSRPLKNSMPKKSLNDAWNTSINYTVKEDYSRRERNFNGSKLIVKSGTDLVRTIYGGYWEGKSINPTMKVDVKPKIVEESIYSTPFVSSIMIGGEMLTGDREVVEYYIVFKNKKSGKIYTTPKLESMYGYYFNPRELIPDFEFCTDYTTKVVLAGDTHENIDVKMTERSEKINLCDFNKILRGVEVRRLLKNDGNYMTVTGFSGKYFEEDIRYKIVFQDPSSSSEYETPIINSSEGLSIFKVEDVITRWVDYRKGENFPGKVVFVDSPETRGSNVTISNNSIYFVWNDWNITKSLRTHLKLKDERIGFQPYLRLRARPYIDEDFGKEPWTTKFYNRYRFDFPFYYSDEAEKNVTTNTDYEYNIKDLNTGEIVYGLKVECSNLRYKRNGNDTWTMFDYDKYNSKKERDKWLKRRRVFRDFCMRDSRRIEYFDRNEPIPEFNQGHQYLFSFKVIGSNADKFINPEPRQILYVDSFQFIANNPLLRSRFAYMQNHPTNFFEEGVEYSSNKEFIPKLNLVYRPVNTEIDYNTGEVKKANVSEREIKIKNIYTIDRFYYFNEEYKENEPVFSSLIIEIIPLRNVSTKQKRDSFNCKIGRYDGICKRGNNGYHFNYIDKTNKIMYKIDLYTYSFLKKYRDASDNGKKGNKYDAVIYDILTQIERNPIRDFKIDRWFEKNFTIDQLIRAKFLEPSFDAHKERPSFWMYSRCPYDSFNNNFYWNPNFSVIDRTLGKSISSKIFSGEFNKVSSQFSKWLLGLDLKEYHKYEIKASDQGSSQVIIWVPFYFVYYEDYFDWIYNYLDAKEHLKRITNGSSGGKVNSVIMGPAPFNLFEKEMSKNYPYIDSIECGLFYYGDIFNFNNPSNCEVFPQYYEPDDSINLMFSVNPDLDSFYDDEQISIEQLKENTVGDRRKKLSSNRYYSFKVNEYENIYLYYSRAPRNNNMYSTNLSGVVCRSRRMEKNGNSQLILNCEWSNVDKLEVYEVHMTQIFLDKTRDDLYNLPDPVLNDYKYNFAEPVLSKYLEWYPPTPIANNTYAGY